MMVQKVRLLEVVKDPIKKNYLMIQTMKFGTNLLLIGGNVADFYYQSVLLIYIYTEVQVHLHSTLISSSNLSQNLYNSLPLLFLWRTASIALANSVLKAKFISQNNDCDSFVKCSL